jgi:xylulokinase
VSVREATLGIDVGTTALKTALVSSEPLRVQHGATVEHRAVVVDGDRVEHRTSAWWEALQRSLERFASEDLDRVAGVAVSGQGSTFALCNAAGHPLMPAIGWSDQRAGSQARRLESQLAEELQAAHGNAIGDAPEPKLVWLHEHHPDILARADLMLGAAGIVSVELGGTPHLNEGDAGSWLCWDRHRRTWSTGIARAIGAHDVLPVVRAAGSAAGAVSARGARATGLRVGTPIVASSTDLGAAALAAGACSPGEAHYSKGTGGFLCAHALSVPPSGRLLALHTGWRDVVQLVAATDTLGAAFDWCRRLVGDPSLDRSAELMEAVPPGSDGVTFLPWLQGANHPLLVPDARAAGFGFSLHTSPGALLRAVLEGTSTLLGHHVAAAEESTGKRITTLVASGGPTRSRLWNRLDAAAIERPIVISSHTDAAVGSAIIAGEALGLWPDANSVGEQLRGAPVVIEPEAQLVAAARLAAERFRTVAAMTLHFALGTPTEACDVQQELATRRSQTGWSPAL